MNVKIDKAGRLVLPKRVRERFRLRAGAALELEEHPEGLILRPVARRASMAQENVIWSTLERYLKDWIGMSLSMR